MSKTFPCNESLSGILNYNTLHLLAYTKFNTLSRAGSSNFHKGGGGLLKVLH